MIFDCNDRKYEIILGSDIVADGMYLEAREVEEPTEVLLFAFWSDVDGSFTFSSYKQDLPFVLVEVFVQMARERLPDRTFEQQNK
jgi:hypothetical protein